jgi:hypothetical protein
MFNGTQPGSTIWGKARPCRDREPERCFHFTPVLFIIKPQKIRRALSDIEQTKLYNGVTFASKNLCPMLVIAFGGGPMTNILLYNVRSTGPQPLTVLMAA